MFNKRIMLLMSTLCSLSVLTGCGNKGGHGGDESKVIVNVSAYNGGFDLKWLYELEKRYEEKHKDEVYGSKKGIDINVCVATTTAPDDSSSITHEDYHIYFGEDIPYVAWSANNVFLDLAPTFDAVNPYDGKTISSKLSKQLNDGYNIGGKIYGIPYSLGTFGIIYNKTLFTSKKLYISKASTSTYTKFTNKDSDKSAGPDGNYDTEYDNGLPATYNQFFDLCNKIVEKGDIPFTWPGASKYFYLAEFMYSMLASNEGYDGIMNRLYMNDSADNLGLINASNEFINDEEPTQITKDNGYELFRSKGTLDAYDFMYKVLTNTTGANNLKYYQDENGSDITNNKTHYESQTTFRNGWNDQDVLMSLEGTWFECESAKHIDNYFEDNDDLGFMPLPKPSVADLSEEERQPVLFDSSNSLCYVKGNISDENVKKCTLDFLQYVYSDEGLNIFTQKTNSFISIDYDLTSETLENLTTFGQDIYNMRKNGDVVYQVTNNTKFSNNWTYLRSRNAFKTNDANTPFDSFTNGKKTPQAYFTDSYNYYKNQWKNLNN